MGTIFFKQIKNAAITAGSYWQPTETSDLTEDDVNKYGPFNHLTVYNNSDKDAEVRFYSGNISDKGVEFLPAGSALVFDKADGLEYFRPSIFSDSAIAADKIILQVRKVI